MRKIHLVLVLIALWNAIPGNSPFSALFDLAIQHPTSGGDITTQADPETDPIMISIPPPRKQ
ncbi:MAG TPA: hypothetical protein VNM67_24725 [Thermoanaerobaculia bacterium]|jgi:hypothetical protein|nr:hypothetical protein [Thermoanaerobaculia bacterium]